METKYYYNEDYVFERVKGKQRLDVLFCDGPRRIGKLAVESFNALQIYWELALQPLWISADFKEPFHEPLEQIHAAVD